MRTIFRIMFVFILVLFLGSIAWNILIFRDCVNHGQPMYRCSAAMQNPNYVWVDG